MMKIQTMKTLKKRMKMTDMYCEHCFKTGLKKHWLDENGGVYCSEECLAESRKAKERWGVGI
jgi:hypothetical protein